MIRRPPRSTRKESSAASDVYKRQEYMGKLMYQRVEIQKKFTEDALSCKTMQKEFERSVKEDTTRKNEDTAKKRAVEQGMDYDNFHQMVLGANLKPIKKGDFMNVTSQKKVLNLVSKNTEPEVIIPELKIEEEKFVEPRNQEEFDKYFSKRLDTPLDKFRYMRMYGMKKFEKLFKGDIDCEMFMRMVKVMIAVAKKEMPETTPDDIAFVCSFLHALVTSSKFEFMYKFITDGEKKEVKELLGELDKILGKEMQSEREGMKQLLE
eukprot:TRINITY_DN8850_c0_g2_i5.p1 TRINITY_DN8850_c0_g2~~TRINITY_DN8850_c0_g2_i5.p1  ORF type:complete len:272 (+),score=90.64 TRINITY_DN8850_c0_g2_i5:26-817(+)